MTFLLWNFLHLLVTSKMVYCQENCHFLTFFSTDKIYGLFLPHEKKKPWRRTILALECYEQTQDWVKHAFDLVNNQTYYLQRVCFCNQLFHLVWLMLRLQSSFRSCNLSRLLWSLFIVQCWEKELQFVFKGKRKLKDQGRNYKQRLVY